jgi:hypothetical protein
VRDRLSKETLMTSRWLVALLLFVAVSTLPAGAHDELRFIGTVVKVDAKTNTLSVKYRENGKDETVEIDLTAKTEITRDKQTIPRAQLRAGSYVVVDALGCEDEYEAVSVRIVPAPAPARPATPPSRR